MAKKRRIPDRYAMTPQNEDWIKMLSRDVDMKGKEIPNRFDAIAKQQGKKFTPLRKRRKAR